MRQKMCVELLVGNDKRRQMPTNVPAYLGDSVQMPYSSKRDQEINRTEPARHTGLLEQSQKKKSEAQKVLEFCWKISGAVKTLANRPNTLY